MISRGEEKVEKESEFDLYKKERLANKQSERELYEKVFVEEVSKFAKLCLRRIMIILCWFLIVIGIKLAFAIFPQYSKWLGPMVWFCNYFWFLPILAFATVFILMMRSLFGAEKRYREFKKTRLPGISE